MKKTWVKRENIYYKPFYKQKSKMLLLAIFLLGIIFFVYQAFSITQLPTTSTLSWNDRIRKKKNRDGIDRGGGGAEADYGVVDEVKSLEKQIAIATAEDAIKIIRGIRLFDYDSYKPNFQGKFKCLDNSKEIPFHRVNDDYCDCVEDGSDEPSTNACANGRFFCKYQKRHITGRGRDIYVPSSRVNDGICDCCDGSDEWLTVQCQKKCT